MQVKKKKIFTPESARLFLLSFIIIPIYFFNSCTSDFLKHIPFFTIGMLLCYAIWLFLANQNDIFFARFIHLTWPLIFCTTFLSGCIFFNCADYINELIINFYNSLFLIIISAIFIFYSQKERKKERRIIITFWFIDTVCGCIYSIIRLQKDPLLSRYLSTGDAAFYLEDIGVPTVGIVTFGTINALVLLNMVIVYLIFAYKNKLSIWGIIFLLISFFTIIQCQFVIALILYICSSIVLINILINKKNKIFFMINLFITFIAIIFIDDIISFFIINDIFPLTITERLIMLNDFFKGQVITGSNIYQRGILYLRSINVFYENFGIGTVFLGFKASGKHSELFDMLANYGVIYTALMIGFMVKIYNLTKSLISLKTRTIYTITYIIFLIISILNTSLWAPTMLVLLVIIPFILQELTDEEEVHI